MLNGKFPARTANIPEKNGAFILMAVKPDARSSLRIEIMDEFFSDKNPEKFAGAGRYSGKLTQSG